MNTSEESDTELLGKALEAVKEASTKTYDELAEMWEHPFPPTISVGDTLCICITPDGRDSLIMLAKKFRQEYAQLRQNFLKEECLKLVTRTFGELIVGLHPYYEVDLKELKKKFKSQIREQLSVSKKPIYHYFPCQTLVDAAVKEFEVGPVKFIRKEDEWIRFMAEKAGSKAQLIEALSELFDKRLEEVVEQG